MRMPFPLSASKPATERGSIRGTCIIVVRAEEDVNCISMSFINLWANSAHRNGERERGNHQNRSSCGTEKKKIQNQISLIALKRSSFLGLRTLFVNEFFLKTNVHFTQDKYINNGVLVDLTWLSKIPNWKRAHNLWCNIEIIESGHVNAHT